jgi:pimeloyl-ACP methyl ester carboxylesterase
METDMSDKRTQFINVNGGRIAYDVTGTGPLVVLSHGMGENRGTYRFLAPLIAAAGYRVATVDLRGQGESSVGWDSYSRADTAADLTELIAALGGPAVIVGQSFSGGAATIAAGTHPELVRAVVEIDPFTRPATVSLTGLLRSRQYRRGAPRLIWVGLTGSMKTLLKYHDIAYPEPKPADWDAWLDGLRRNLSEPGRMKALQKMGMSKPVDAGAQLPNVRCPVLVIVGTLDPDFPDPEAEAAAIVGLLPQGLGRYTMIDGGGRYPQAGRPEQVAAAIIPFLKEHAGA